jgi:DNA-binding transcriptional ArsR family regulator
LTFDTLDVILNHVVQYQTLDRTLGAIADPTRRQILDRLSRGPASITELASPLHMTLTGVKKHVAVLEEAGLVVSEKVGRTRNCRLGPARLDDAINWIEFYRSQWESRLDGLEAYLDKKERSG